ncbi:MAG: phosphoserine phosphatase SerB [Pacificimonas sp.]
MFSVTLVGTPHLSAASLALASEKVGGTGERWLVDDRVARFETVRADLSELEDALPDVDVFVRANDAPQPKLFVADMDSTMITVECIDELADYAGLKAEVQAVTEAAMRGELDFEAALRERVALLKGLPETTLADCLRERVTYTPGAKDLIAHLSKLGVRTILVSGGFTAFAAPVGTALGFDRVVANILEIADGRLTGGLAGPVVDAETKRRVLLEEASSLGIETDEVIAIGDGANDIEMVRAAGFGIAYRAKPALAEVADARIRNGDLSVLIAALQ